MQPTLLSSRSMTLPRSRAVPAAYRPLYTYLNDRYAGTVVLTFAEIEDLMGDMLPAVARAQTDWWADACADGSSSAQSTAWREAKRSASANLMAQKVTFESVAG
jgi:hypothetical protein